MAKGQPTKRQMTEQLRILVAEDMATDAELVLMELARAGLRATHRIVDSEKSFVDALREFAPDVILSDFSLPGFNGMAALALSREMRPDTPFIFVDRKSTRLNSSHSQISYAVFCLKKKKKKQRI